MRDEGYRATTGSRFALGEEGSRTEGGGGVRASVSWPPGLLRRSKTQREQPAVRRPWISEASCAEPASEKDVMRR